VRLRRATAAPCLPSAVRVSSGRCAIVFWPAAARWAFFTLRLAAWVCLFVAMIFHCHPGPLRAGLSAVARLASDLAALAVPDSFWTGPWPCHAARPYARNHVPRVWARRGTPTASCSRGRAGWPRTAGSAQDGPSWQGLHLRHGFTPGQPREDREHRREPGFACRQGVLHAVEQPLLAGWQAHDAEPSGRDAAKRPVNGRVAGHAPGSGGG
jgi:hypothetical protein